MLANHPDNLTEPPSALPRNYEKYNDDDEESQKKKRSRNDIKDIRSFKQLARIDLDVESPRFR